MDSQAPLPKPPPPPPPPSGLISSNSNTTRTLSARSQLLADIERGTTLKKVSQSQYGSKSNSRHINHVRQISSSNENNGIENNNYGKESVTGIENQFLAELSSTLRRRQTGGNKNPDFIVPKNTTINAINNQLQSNAPSEPTRNGKSPTDAKQNKPSTDNSEKDEKPKILISHEKRNFTISSSSMNFKKLQEKDDNASGSELLATLRRGLKSSETLSKIEPIIKSSDKSFNEHKPVPKPKPSVADRLKITSVSNRGAESTIGPPSFYKASASSTQESVKGIENLVQAELSSTLRRRQSVGNKKPDFPKNTTINAINNQLCELLSNTPNQPDRGGKTTTYAKHNKPSTDDNEKDEKPKLLLSHEKRNFTISSSSMNSKKFQENDDNASGSELLGTARLRRTKSMVALHKIEPIIKSSDKSVNEQKFVPKVIHQFQKCIQDQINVSNRGPKLPKLPFHKASGAITSATSSTHGDNEVKRIMRRLKPVKLLKQTKEPELNDVQRRMQNLKNVEINSSSNGFTSEMRKDKAECNKTRPTSIRSVTETDNFLSSPILLRKAKQLDNSKAMPPKIHNRGNVNYKVKPITSLSPNLQSSPNRYLEKVTVTKTVEREPEPTIFSGIKFTISSNGDVAISDQ